MTYAEALETIEEKYFVGDTIEKDDIEYEIIECFPSPSDSVQLGIFIDKLRNGEPLDKAILAFMHRNDLEIYIKLQNLSTNEKSECLVQDIGNVE